MFIVNAIAGTILSAVPIVNTIVSLIVSLLMVAVTVRRVQDSGHSAWWPCLSILSSIILELYMQFSGYMDAIQTVNPNPQEVIGYLASPLFWIPAAVGTVTGIATFIFCLFDSTVGPNKYGDSPKYVSKDLVTKE